MNAWHMNLLEPSFELKEVKKIKLRINKLSNV